MHVTHIMCVYIWTLGFETHGPTCLCVKLIYYTSTLFAYFAIFLLTTFSELRHLRFVNEFITHVVEKFHWNFGSLIVRMHNEILRRSNWKNHQESSNIHRYSEHCPFIFLKQKLFYYNSIWFHRTPSSKKCLVKGITLVEKKRRLHD